MMGIAPAELMRLELREFYAIYSGWSHLRAQQMREDMERARWHAAVSITPHIKSTGKSITEMLPLPWDEKSKVEDMTIEERRERVRKIMQQIEQSNEQ